LCVNTLVPFDADLAARHSGKRRPPIVEGGLPLVLAQTFRAIVHSRMEVGMSRYRREYPDADVVLFEPERGDPEMFFANVFSYADRRRLCEHAYQRTRAALRQRHAELEPIFARHGVTIDRSVLDDESRTLLPANNGKAGRRFALMETISSLEEALDRLSGTLKQARAA
jgi:NTE family protein